MPQTTSLSPEDRDGVVRYLAGVHPNPREGDTHACRELYGGRWLYVRGGWVPESEEMERRRRDYEVRKAAPLDMERLLSDGKREELKRDKTPGWDELKKRFPKLNVVEHEKPDGSVEKSADFSDLTLDGRDKKALLEMFGEAREVEIEQSEDLSSRVDWTEVGKGQQKRMVRAEDADKVGRRLAEQGS